MIKHFRAWDGEQYWYSNEDWFFVYGFKSLSAQEAPFKTENIEQFIGKFDSNGSSIFENDLVINTQQENSKTYQIIWSSEYCGFCKVPQNMPFPETSIDETFLEVIGTIHSTE